MTRCPGCARHMFRPYALSRYDNQTDICSDCGRDEAIAQFHGKTLTAPSRWWRLPAPPLSPNELAEHYRFFPEDKISPLTAPEPRHPTRTTNRRRKSV